MSIPTVKCPTCGKSVAWSTENRFRPFCCERCKLIDLGEWANETRIIKGAPLTEQDLEDLEQELGQMLEDTDRKLH